ncbi:MAG: ABC transporter permease [Balneolaceae bacterium]|jgi:ABC-type lipoprotein release transport system permease subunit
MFYLKLAWRNIWRNKRRTAITTFSIVLAVVLSSFTRSMQIGTYDQMIQNSAGMYTGYLQIHKDGYWDKPTLDNSFVNSDSLLNEIMTVNHVTKVVPRLQSYALAAGKQKSRAAMIIGFAPGAEQALSNPGKNVIEGTYITSDTARSVLITEGLASYLNLAVGDSLVLLGQGYHGMSAADVYPVQGIVKYGIPEMNRAMVFLPIGEAQYFFGTYNRLTAAALTLDDAHAVNNVKEEIQKKLDGDYEVMTWRQLMPELVQAIEADNSSGMIILLVLYIVVGFGIMGTILMMTAERQYEFGVMLSIGTSRVRLGSILLLELVLLAMLGIFIGSLGSLPLVWYFHLNPIHFSGDAAAAMRQYGMEPLLPFSTDPTIILGQAMIILGLTAAISFYPMWHAHKLNPIKAMRD